MARWVGGDFGTCVNGLLFGGTEVPAVVDWALVVMTSTDVPQASNRMDRFISGFVQRYVFLPLLGGGLVLPVHLSFFHEFFPLLLFPLPVQGFLVVGEERVYFLVGFAVDLAAGAAGGAGVTGGGGVIASGRLS